MREKHNQFCDEWYWVSGELERIGNLRLLQTGNNRAKPDYSVGPKVLSHYVLHFVTCGKACFTHGSKEYVVEEGGLFCILPNVSSVYSTVDRSTPLEMSWINLTGELVPYLLNKIGIGEDSCYLPGAATPAVLQGLKAIQRVLSQPSDPVLMECMLMQHLFSLFAAIKLTGAAEYGNRPDASWLQKGIDYINLHFRDPITVEEVARFVGVDRTHFTRRFRAQMNITPYQHILGRRMNAAMNMLRHSGLPIQSIAFSVGYVDPSVFTRTFKRFFGKPPSDFM